MSNSVDDVYWFADEDEHNESGVEVAKVDDETVDLLTCLCSNDRVSDACHEMLLASLRLTVFCLVAFEIAQFVGSTVMSPIVALVFDARSSLFVAYFVLIYDYCRTRGFNDDHRMEVRVALLIVSLVSGVLGGFSLSHRKLPSPIPSPHLLNALIAKIACLIDPNLAPDRFNYIGIIIVPSVILCLAVGLKNGAGWPFLAYLVCSAIVNTVLMQLVIGRMICKDAIAAMAAVFGDLTIQAVLLYGFGCSIQDIQSRNT